MNCRHCKKNLNDCFLDLGTAPPSNSYLTKTQLNIAENYYPLKVYVCKNCWLVQVIDYAGRDIFFNDFPKDPTAVLAAEVITISFLFIIFFVLIN